MKFYLKTLFLFSLALLVTLPAFSDDWLYTIRRGDTATTIANKYLINPYRIDKILEYNQLNTSKQLNPGQVIKFPLDSLKFGPARVEVLSVQGEVFHVRGDKRNILTTLTPIVFNDRILTERGGSTTLKFADKSELLLGENSELTFDVLTRWGRTGMVDSRMRLFRGSVEGRVETLEGPGAHFEVHTPSAVATVRGTEFRVRVDQDNTEVSYNEVSEGKVNVKNSVAAELIPTGFGIVAEANQETGAPIELLEAPEILEKKTSFSSLPVSVKWQKDLEATGYRVEIFAGTNIEKQINTSIVMKPELILNALESGSYLMRIRAIDINGLEGLNSIFKFSLSRAPKAPKALSNSRKEYYFGNQIDFNWQAVESADSYFLQLSKDYEFTEILSETNIETNEYQLINQLNIGTYYWRLNSVNKFGKGQASRAENFYIVAPKKPVISPISDISINQVGNVNWSPVENASNYRWQLSADKNFKSIIKESETKKLQVRLDALKKGDYYFRVTPMIPGYENNYSQTRTFEVYDPEDDKAPYIIGFLLLLIAL